MSQPNKKSCIQKRISTKISKRPAESVLIVSISILAVAFLIMENSPYPYHNYLSKLEYNQIKDLVTLIVTTDGFIIAFTGVIASMILRHVFEEEKEMKKISDLAISDKNRIVDFVYNYKKKSHEIIKFVLLILIALVGSIGFSLSVIMTQYFPLLIVSIMGLFIGLMELVFLIYFSLKI